MTLEANHTHTALQQGQNIIASICILGKPVKTDMEMVVCILNTFCGAILI